MIKITVLNNQAKLLETQPVPMGNAGTVSLQFQIEQAEAWEGALKSAVIETITPWGEKQYKQTLIEENGAGVLPALPAGVQNSILKIGLRGVFANGSVITTNMVFCGMIQDGAAAEDRDDQDDVEDDVLPQILEKMHDHENLDVLDKFGEDGGALTFDGSVVGATGPAGQDGADGLGIESISIHDTFGDGNDNYYVITIRLTDGTQVQLPFAAPAGERGETGRPGADGRDGLHGGHGAGLGHHAVRYGHGSGQAGPACHRELPCCSDDPCHGPCCCGHRAEPCPARLRGDGNSASSSCPG